MHRKIAGKLLDSKEQEIAEFIEQQRRSGTTLKQLRFKTGLPENTCKELLKNLEKKCIVVQRGIGHNVEFVHQKYTPSRADSRKNWMS